jgi:hypothetical protein
MEPLFEGVGEVVVALELGVPPDARLGAIELRDPRLQGALQVRHPSAAPFVKLDVVEMRVADEGVPFVFVRHKLMSSYTV